MFANRGGIGIGRAAALVSQRKVPCVSRDADGWRKAGVTPPTGVLLGPVTLAACPA
jgi:hypothetical protein